MAYYLYQEMQEFSRVILDLSTVDTHSSIISLHKRYQEKGNPSKAGVDFYNDLYQIATRYYTEKIYAKKSFFGKFACIIGPRFALFFGAVNKEESNFMTLRNSVGSMPNHYDEKKRWALPWYRSYSLKLLNHEQDVFKAFEQAILKKNVPKESEEKIRTKVRLIAHRLVGNHRLGGRDVEGLNHSFAIYKTYRELCKFKLRYPSSAKQLDDTILAMQQLFILTSKIVFSKNLYALSKSQLDHDRRLADIDYDIRKTLTELPLGLKMFMPSGYNTSEGGHGTLVEWQKKDNEKYDLRFINTGAGVAEIKALSQIFSFLVGRKVSVILVKDLTLTEIEELSLIPRLLQGLYNVHKDDESGVKAMIAPLKDLQKRGRLELGEEIPAQRNGTCADSSVQALTQLNLGNKLFNLFKYFSLNRALAKTEKLKQSTHAHVQTVIQTLTAARRDGQQVNRRGVQVLDELSILGQSQVDELKTGQKEERKRLAKDRNTEETKFGEHRKHPEREKVIDEAYIVHLRAKVDRLKQDYMRQAPDDYIEPLNGPPRRVFGLFAGHSSVQPAWERYIDKQKKLEAAVAFWEQAKSIALHDSVMNP